MDVTFTRDLLAGAAPLRGDDWQVTGTETETGDLVTVTMPETALFALMTDSRDGDQVAAVAPAQVTARLPLRMAVVAVRDGRPGRDQIAAYLPGGYQVAGGMAGADWIITGHDVNNFTLEWTCGRLASGGIAARILPGYAPGG